MMQSINQIKYALFTSIWLVMLWNANLFSQATQVSISVCNEEDAYYTGVPIYIKVLAKDNNNANDQTYNGDATLEAVGPDILNGTTTTSFSNGKASFNLAYVNRAGTYQIRCTSTGLSSSEVKTITVEDNPYTKGGGSATSLKCWDEMYDTVYIGDFFSKYIFALNSNGEIDTTFGSNYTGSSVASVQQISGDAISNITNKKAYFHNGVGIAEQIKIDLEGTYQLVYSSSGLSSDTFTIVAIEIPYDSSNCVIPDSIKAVNLGLYGGVGQDFTFSQTTNRLFMAVESPQSLFFSDDSGKTWSASFPYDSLEYDCGSRGWGGRALRVLTNAKGWVAVYTSQGGGNLNANVVSFNNGDTGTWQTAVDGEILEDWNYGGGYGIINIGLTDYYIYTLSGDYILMQDTDLMFPYKVIQLRDYISSSNRPIVLCVAAANTTTGFPLYVIADTTGIADPTQGSLFKYDGNSITSITLPANISSIEKVFTHPNQITGDTLFISGLDSNQNAYAFSSFDGGINWTDIVSSQNFAAGASINDLDYSPNWVSSLPATNGSILFANETISKDFGVTWEQGAGPHQIKAVLPTNVDFMMRTAAGKIYYNTSGINSTLYKSKCEGLSAFEISQTAKTSDKSKIYIATQAGLAYTTAYNDTNVNYVDKWLPPYGEFPVSTIDSTHDITAVAMDPNDPLHVVSGHLSTIYVTSNGPSGFIPVSPSGYDSKVTLNDIVFVNSNVLLAVKGNNPTENGSLWRSTDGGYNWSRVLPDTFSSGNVLAVAYSNVDTAVYMGSGFDDGTGKLWKSTDMGQSWIKASDGPTCSNNSTIVNMSINAIAPVPTFTGTLYVGASYLNICNAFLYTNDEGNTFQQIYLPNDSSAITAIAINKNYKDSVYIAVGREVFVYDAYKDTVTRVYRGLPGEEIYNLASGSILVGTTTGFYGLHLDENGDYVNLKDMPSNKPDIKIYPNPASEEIFIEIDLKSETDIKLSIVDLMNRGIILPIEKTAMGLQRFTLNTSSLASGTYIVKVQTEMDVTSQIVIIQNPE